MQLGIFANDVAVFLFQYKSITEKWFLLFYKRPGQKHNLIIHGSFFLYISVNQGNLAEGNRKIAIYLSLPYLIHYKIAHVYLPEMSMRMYDIPKPST